MKKFFKVISVIFIILFLAGIILVIGYQLDTRVHIPEQTNISGHRFEVKYADTDFRYCGNNWLHKSKTGLWELYLEGRPYERGIAEGRLTKDLIEIQEKAFTSQMAEIIPSRSYLNFLKYFIYWFNRDLEDYIPAEYKAEIYGISQSASEKFNFIGNNYQRLLNYHSAHDIGHALQDLHMVGCTSFAVWNDKSAGKDLLIGRNFDFYVGDAFAENKILCFENPEKGYPFVMLTWGGMAGAVSGMNLEGLTVTINAAKSDIPHSARTPISILAREILQYARNIPEAWYIASKRQTFVSESILIGSASDGKAVIIEKSPSKIALKEPDDNFLVSTNHFRTSLFSNDAVNRRDMAEKASLYRYKKVVEDITDQQPLDVFKVANILRDQTGLHKSDIGMGNEKAINQLIAHHSMIFDPSRRLVWISNGPWQIGGYTCYNLVKIFHNFAALHHPAVISEAALALPPDPFYGSKSYESYQRFRQYRKLMKNLVHYGKKSNPGPVFFQNFIRTNPGYYEVYSLTGDFYYYGCRYDSAMPYYRLALGKVIPSENDKQKIIERLADCIAQMKQKRL